MASYRLSKLDRKKSKYLGKFASHLRRVRTEKNFSQTQLANMIGKDKQTIQKLESAKFNPSIFLVWEIAQGLECSPSELLDFEM